MIPFYLVLAHLAADFVFQPKALVKFKERSFWGVMIHAGIHVFLSLILLIPFLNDFNVWLAVFIIGIVHLIIDQGKISIQVKTDKYLYPFLLDQFFHFLAIFSVVLYFGLHLVELTSFEPNWIFITYNNPLFPVLLQILVFVTVVIDIARFQVKREKNRY
jgi:hypothetical protein